MNQRGRKSSASLTVLPAIPRQRPDPPDGLTPEQARTWREVVAALPPEWFEKGPELLRAYCRHSVFADRVARLIDATDLATLATDEGLKRYDRLSAMHARETAAAANLATKMRLTQQARYTAQSAATAANRTPPGRKPWERA
jgi:hypothetical protein